MINCHNNQHICLLPEFIYFNGFKTVFKFANLFFYSFSPLSQECIPQLSCIMFVYSKKAGKYVLCYIFTRFLQRSNFLLAGN